MEENTVITLKRALEELIPIFLASALMAGAIISLANDTYAFVKSDKPATLTISSPITDTQLSRSLKESGVINNELAFLLYIRAKGKSEDVSLLLGEWSLNSNMSYREIVNEIF